ncbi:MAG: restriction endonuclease subunit S, partial [Terriglobia bacterium]
ILFLDRNLAKQTNEILFVKVENDGFDLGAQRRPIEGSDLTGALRIMDSHKKGQQTEENKMAHIVRRKRILESPDVGLSGDRYLQVSVRANGKWPMVKLGDVCTQILSGGTPSTRVPGYWKGDIPWITSADIHGLKEVQPRKYITREAVEHSATNLIPADNVVVVTRVGLGKVLLNPFDLCISQDSQGLVIDRKQISSAYLAYVLSQEVLKFKDNSRGSTIQGVVKSQLAELEIPLPPLEEQERIVTELEGYRKVIEGARQVLAHYKPTIRIDPKWPIKKVAQLCELVRGSSPRPKSDPRYYGGKVPRLMVADLTRDGMYVNPQIDFLTEEGAKFSRPMKRNEVVMAVSGNPGLPAILQVNAYIHDGFVGFRSLKDEVLPEFFYHVLSYFKEHSGSQSIGAVFKNLTT